MPTRKPHLIVAVASLIILCPAAVWAGIPSDFNLGEAPVLFTAAEGEDADGTVLLDGQAVRGDEIWLWVPAVIGGQVDLGSTGQFFKVWDSGPEAGPNGNDDDDNGMRGMDYDPISETFLISYEDTTTTGFAIGGIADGALLQMTPTAVANGFVTGFGLSVLYDEGTNGTPGALSARDINGVSRADDGTFHAILDNTQTVQTSGGGSISLSSGSNIGHYENFDGNPSPAHIEDDLFANLSTAGPGVIFPPAVYTGELRGVDVLDDGLITFGTSGDYRNTDFNGPIDGLTDAQAEALATGVSVVGDKADILMVPNFSDGALNSYQRHEGAVLYDGSLFFQSPAVGDAEILDHDILDLAEVLSLIDLLGANSDAGIALSVFPEPSSLMLLAFGAVLVARRKRR